MRLNKYRYFCQIKSLGLINKSNNSDNLYDKFRLSLGLIVFQVYILLLPIYEIPKLSVSGYLEEFIKKIEYVDLLLVLLFLLLAKDIYQYIKNKKNKPLIIILFIVVVSWIISAIYSWTYIGLLDTLGLMMLILLFLVVAVLAEKKRYFIIINRTNFYTVAVMSLIGIIMFIAKYFIDVKIFDPYFAEQYSGNAAVFMDRIRVFTKSP